MGQMSAHLHLSPATIRKRERARLSREATRFLRQADRRATRALQPRPVEETTAMQAAFVSALTRWCETAGEASAVRIGAMSSRAELARVICSILRRHD
jgi:hypothetical protein